MKTSHKVILLILSAVFLVVLVSCANQPEIPSENTPEPVTLQLPWVTQAQFAGYYVALDKGWYLEEGIDLTIKPGGPDVIASDAVISGIADFGISLLADIVVSVEQGKPLKSVCQIQQTNGLLLIAKKESGIENPQDFRGKQVGVWLGSWQAQFDALIAKEGLTTQDFHLVSQGFSMDSFLSGDLDVASAMIYNEYHVVLESGLSPSDINVIDYADFGLDFPGDALMTNLQTIEQRPDLVTRMVRATLRGWQYAVENPEETVDIVMKYDQAGILNREHQISMMNEIANLVQITVRPIGFTNSDDIRRTINTLFSYSVINESLDTDDVFTNEFWELASTDQ